MKPVIGPGFRACIPTGPAAVCAARTSRLLHFWEDVTCQPSERSVQCLLAKRQSYWWSKEDTGDLNMKSTELWGFLWQVMRAACPTEAVKGSGGSHGSAFASLEKVCKEATLMKLGQQHQWLNASFLYHKTVWRSPGLPRFTQ